MQTQYQQISSTERDLYWRKEWELRTALFTTSEESEETEQNLLTDTEAPFNLIFLYDAIQSRLPKSANEQFIQDRQNALQAASSLHTEPDDISFRPGDILNIIENNRFSGNLFVIVIATTATTVTISPFSQLAFPTFQEELWTDLSDKDSNLAVVSVWNTKEFPKNQLGNNSQIIKKYRDENLAKECALLQDCLLKDQATPNSIREKVGTLMIFKDEILLDYQKTEAQIWEDF